MKAKPRRATIDEKKRSDFVFRVIGVLLIATAQIMYIAFSELVKNGFPYLLIIFFPVGMAATLLFSIPTSVGDAVSICEYVAIGIGLIFCKERSRACLLTLSALLHIAAIIVIIARFYITNS